MAGIEVKGLEKASMTFKLKGKKMADIAYIWLNKEIRPFVYQEIIGRHFKDESAGGTPWKALAASTKRDRERLGIGGAHPILQRTSAGGISTKRSRETSLLDEVMGKSSNRTSRIDRTKGSVSLSYTIFSHKAWAHQTGRGKRGQNLPARPFMLLSNQDRRSLRGKYDDLLKTINSVRST